MYESRPDLIACDIKCLLLDIDEVPTLELEDRITKRAVRSESLHDLIMQLQPPHQRLSPFSSSNSM